MNALSNTKKHEFHLNKCEFKLLFNDYQCSPYGLSKLSDNKTMISWSIFLEKMIDDFKNQAYIFNHITEVNIITIANERDMSYDFSIKHKMHAVEWNIKAMINKNKI